MAQQSSRISGLENEHKINNYNKSQQQQPLDQNQPMTISRQLSELTFKEKERLL